MHSDISSVFCRTCRTQYPIPTSLASIKTYFPNLDALRAIAALGVIFIHISRWLSWPDSQVAKWTRLLFTLDGSSGRAGVDFFFVLSGFLITSLMFHEQGASSSFSVKNFYIRRALRIWPLYFVTLIVGFAVYPRLAVDFHEIADWRMFALFLANFDAIYNSLPKDGMLGVQWSIAIEEQFYLLWPLVFLLFGNKRQFGWICLALILISIIFHFSGQSQFHTLIALNQLSTGAFLAYLVFYHRGAVIAFFERLSKLVTLIIYLSGIVLLAANFQITVRFPFYAQLSDIPHTIFFSFVILEQIYSPHSFYKFGSIRWLTWLGKISYGLYLLHMVAIYLVRHIESLTPMSVWLSAVLTLTMTVALSAVSYYLFEQPFLRLKEKFNSPLQRAPVVNVET